jgi:hypothetical protein
VRAKTIAALLASAAIVVLCLPGGAVAGTREVWVTGPTSTGPARRAGKTRVTQELNLHGTNGYKLKVTLDNRHRLGLQAIDTDFAHRTITTVAYGLPVHQRRGSDDIKAQIGSLGRIDMRFVAERTKKAKPGSTPCAGGELTTEVGHYVGSISFHGDGGYTRAQAHRVAGSIETESVGKCPPPKRVKAMEKEEAETVGKVEEEEQAKRNEEEGLRQVEAKARGGKVVFTAARIEAAVGGRKGSSANFVAVGQRERGPMREVSLVGLTAAKGSTFQVPDLQNPTAEAIVSPPSPFSGSATFRAESPQPDNWAGDLNVELPGFGTVPLTGSGVKASICQASDCSSGGLFSEPIADGSAEVTYAADITGRPNSFGVPESLDPPATATIKPPAPFSARRPSG